MLIYPDHALEGANAKRQAAAEKLAPGHFVIPAIYALVKEFGIKRER
jgi:hypothetical protein